MASKIDICNMALAQMRADPIVSLAESSQEAMICNTYYETCLDFVLSDTQWNFLRKTEELTLSVTKPEAWAYMYGYPADCLQLVGLIPKALANSFTGYYGSYESYQNHHEFIPPEYAVMHEAGQKVIVTNLEDAVAVYTLRITDVSLLPAGFTLALSYYLASQIVSPIVGDNEGRALKQSFINEYQAMLSAARVHDSLEHQQHKKHSPIMDAYDTIY